MSEERHAVYLVICDVILGIWLTVAFVILSGCSEQVTIGDGPDLPRSWGLCMANEDCTTPGWRDCRKVAANELGECHVYCVSPSGIDQTAECQALGGECDSTRECMR